MKHNFLLTALILFATITAYAQQPPQIEQLNNKEWSFTRTVNYSTCDIIAVAKYVKINISVPQKTYEYDGTAHTPATVTVGDKELSLENGDYHYSDNVNIGKVSIFVKNNGGGETEFPNVFEIVAKEAEIVWSNTTLEYNGNKQKPDAILKGVTDGDKYEIQITGEQTLPGTYTASAEISGLDNYRITGNQSTPFTITPKMLNIVADSKTKIYGESDPKLTYTVKGLLGDDKLTGELSRQAGENAGTYTINAGSIAAKDYYKISFTNADFIIEPFDNVTIEWGVTDFVYNGKSQVPSATVVGLKNGDQCNANISGAQTDAGNYVATVESLSNPNYKLSSTYSTDFTIAKANVDVIPPTPIEGIIFNNHKHTLISAGSTTGGTMLYKLVNGNYSESLPQAANVGIYEVFYYVDGGKNYNSTQEQCVKAIISPTDLPVIDAEKMECNLSAEHFCNGKAKLIFMILAGSAYYYSITFNNPEIPTQTGEITENGELYFSVPKTLKLGTYNATIVFSDKSGKQSEAYNFDFEVTRINDLIKQLYYNTLSADNHEQIYTSYQWRHNGNDLDGETHQYLHLKDGLSGYFTVNVNIVGYSQQAESCPFYINNISSKKEVSIINIYPNPATANQQITIEIPNFNPETKYQISIYNNSGICVKTYSNTQATNTLSLPPGSYSGIMIHNGEKNSFKIIVK